MSELEGEGGKDVVKISAVFEIARTEERCSQPPVSEDAFGNRLRDRGLASSGEPIQPVDGRRVGVFGPRLHLVEDGFTSPFEATRVTAMPELSPFGTDAVVQHRQFSC